MTGRYLLGLLALVAVLSCSKEKNDSYYVNASKMIGLTGNNWNNMESQLRDKNGYKYTTATPNSGIKAVVDLKAVDDSNRAVNGAILLNIANDNRVQFAMFNTDPITQSVAYAMMLNYNNASLQSISGITSSVGEVQENGMGSNPAVSVVLSKLTSGQIAETLGITYDCAQGHFTIVVFKQSDGHFIFSCRSTL